MVQSQLKGNEILKGRGLNVAKKKQLFVKKQQKRNTPQKLFVDAVYTPYRATLGIHKVPRTMLGMVELVKREGGAVLYYFLNQ